MMYLHYLAPNLWVSHVIGANIKVRQWIEFIINGIEITFFNCIFSIECETFLSTNNKPISMHIMFHLFGLEVFLFILE